MAEFYAWPRNACYLLTLVIAVCVLLQTLTVMVSLYRRRRNLGQVFETILEPFILCHVVVCSLLHGQAMLGYDMGLFVPGGYDGLRVASFAALAVLAGLAAVTNRRPQALAVPAAAGLTLPFVEDLVGGLFAYLYSAAILFFLVRSVRIGSSRYRKIKTNPSALSIKSAMDSLDTGILFFESGGFIVLCSQRMDRLMTTIAGKPQRNGERFMRLLSSGDVAPGCQVTVFEGESACLVPDGSVWLFSRDDMTIKKKKYVQLTATDITDRWRLTAELQAQNAQLISRQKELTLALDNVQALSRQREAQSARMRAHDVLGERLTLLLRMMRSESAPDYPLLHSLMAGLMDKLKAAENVHSPQDDIDILKQTFASIGVEVLFDGALPQDSEKGKLLVDISKEAVINAVRHGFATQVTITMGTAGGRCTMRVTDNGLPPPAAIKEGGGISGMRNRLTAFGGTLRVTTRPGFALNIELPEDEVYAESAYR